jgi:hypothetical protein
MIRELSDLVQTSVHHLSNGPTSLQILTDSLAYFLPVWIELAASACHDKARELMGF